MDKLLQMAEIVIVKMFLITSSVCFLCCCCCFRNRLTDHFCRNVLYIPSQQYTASTKYLSASAETTGQTSCSPPNSLI